MSDIDLNFKVEWEDAGGVRSHELRATWCRLELWVGQECVTRVEDTETNAARRSIFVPAYPLAEWIAYHWWYLKADHRPTRVPTNLWAYASLVDDSAVRNGWLKQHNMRGAGDGYPWPDITLVPEGDFTRIVWKSGTVRPRGGLRYLSSGEALLDSDQVMSTLASVVELVLTRLDELQIDSTRLHAEWREIRSLADDESEFCAAAARLGLDAFDVPREVAATLEAVGRALPDELLTDFLDAAAPQALAETLEWVDAARQELATLTSPPQYEQLPGLRTAFRESRTPSSLRGPWDVGYSQARAVRKALGISDLARFDVEEFVSDELLAADRRELDGVGSSLEGVRLVRSRTLTGVGKRFAAARALWHGLADPVGASFLLTRARTTRQKIERAFAAELLAPTAGIEHLLQDVGPLWDSQDADAISARYEVRADVVERQIENNIHF